ncbi:MAG: hypothetical protein HFJ17_04520 [Clostridia bacterium]|nr:hypothetical protein [Clostridia bacterium]
MEVSNMKNIVVLKNLPSNLVEEAIVILKTNKVAKRLEYIEKNANKNITCNTKTKEYMIREAESVISSYISKIEDNKRYNGNNSNIERKYKKLKIYSIIASGLALLMLIL